jgi:hypothetical protein
MRFPIIVRRFNRFAVVMNGPALKIPVHYIIDGQPVNRLITLPIKEGRVEQFAAAAEILVLFLFRKPIYAHVTKRKA